MERVAFLVEETHERISCLLNPEQVVMRRRAGVRPRWSATGALTGAGLADAPLLYTGGGTTELDLKLLFDISLGGSSTTSEDVRDLTRPLWDLAENSSQQETTAYRRPPQVRFIWGKSWNIPGVVVAVAERLEYFTRAGVPRRSWLSMRLLRVAELPPATPEATAAATGAVAEAATLAAVGGLGAGAAATAIAAGAAVAEIPEESVRSHQVIAGGGEESECGLTERLDQLADRYYQNPALWRLIANFNDVAQPLCLLPGRVLQLPPVAAIRRAVAALREEEE